MCRTRAHGTGVKLQRLSISVGAGGMFIAINHQFIIDGQATYECAFNLAMCIVPIHLLICQQQFASCVFVDLLY